MKNSELTTKEKVLLHLKMNKSITCLDALKEYNTLYLTKYIQLLRKDHKKGKNNLDIKDKWIIYTTFDNVEKRIKVYYI